MFAKKSLGQNFLKSKAALRAMVEAAQKNGEDGVVLEIGPGKGALTKALLESGEKVLVLEKDDRLIPILLADFKKEIDAGQLEILHTDALTFNPDEIEKGVGEYRVVANIPYYITGSFFRHYLTDKSQPSSMVVMVQKEVAERIVARDNKESLLSLSIKCYGTTRYVMKVQKKYFSPAPKVDSAIIAVENISRDFFIDISEENFFLLIKAGFAHKRKVLIGNLESLTSRQKLHTIFETLKISAKTRAEDITLTDWKNLAREIFKKESA